MTGAGSLWPRRVDGLPPGQRLLERFPRFSDKPLRWAPDPGSASLTISVDGDVLSTIVGTDWERFEYVEQTSDFHCVTTWSVKDLRWGGHPFGAMMRTALERPLDSLPTYMVAEAADGHRAIFRTEDLDRADTLLATHLGNEPLDRRHGAPLRLVSPHQYGYKNVKHLTSMAFCHSRPESGVGPKEHLRARVDREERHSSLPNRLVRTPYRLSIIPTALAAERGLRNSPGSIE